MTAMMPISIPVSISIAIPTAIASMIAISVTPTVVIACAVANSTTIPTQPRSGRITATRVVIPRAVLTLSSTTIAIAAATILGDGRVALILDVSTLLREVIAEQAQAVN